MHEIRATLSGIAIGFGLALPLMPSILPPADHATGPVVVLMLDIEAEGEPVPERTDPASEPDDIDAGPEVCDDSACEICRPIEIRARAMRAVTTPPTVTRPTRSLIIVEGAVYAGTRPFTPPVRGVPVPLAEMAAQFDQGEPIWFEVDPAQDYTVWTAVMGPDGRFVPFDFPAPSDRIGRIRAMLELAAEASEKKRLAENMREDLSPITFFEYLEALADIQANQGAQHERPSIEHGNPIPRDRGDSQEHQGPGAE